MSSLADAPDLVGFFSYSREDDEDSSGRLSKLRERIQAELRGQLGRTKADFRLWQDKFAIAHGELWEDRIKSAVAEPVFFVGGRVAQPCSVVRTRDRVAGAGYACSARPDLHTVCRSFPKISRELFLFLW